MMNDLRKPALLRRNAERALTEEALWRRERRRERQLRAISFLPATATLGNLVCGFVAIFFCLLSMRAEYGEFYATQPRVLFLRFEQLFPTHIAAGAYLIVLAMIFDALDGRLARLTRRTSEFGAQLDSLADIVSFGLAPAALLVTLLLRPELGSANAPADASRFQVQVGMLCAIVYVSCAAIRLARYNAENVKSEQAQKAFSGLPSPGGAAALIALLALHEQVRYAEFSLWGVDWLLAVRWVTMLTALGAGLLMVSRLDYPHLFNTYVRRKQPLSHLVWLIVILALAWFSFELLLVLLGLGYVLSGLVVNLWARFRRREEGAEAPEVANPT